MATRAARSRSRSRSRDDRRRRARRSRSRSRSRDDAKHQTTAAEVTEEKTELLLKVKVEQP
jgi:hypothetical protein